jgi:hypothetical protein
VRRISGTGDSLCKARVGLTLTLLQHLRGTLVVLAAPSVVMNGKLRLVTGVDNMGSPLQVSANDADGAGLSVVLYEHWLPVFSARVRALSLLGMYVETHAPQFRRHCVVQVEFASLTGVDKAKRLSALVEGQGENGVGVILETSAPATRAVVCEPRHSRCDAGRWSLQANVRAVPGLSLVHVDHRRGHAKPRLRLKCALS